MLDLTGNSVFKTPGRNIKDGKPITSKSENKDVIMSGKTEWCWQ